MIKLFLAVTLFTFASKLITAADNTWAERTLETMTTQEKIGQLFMVAGYVDSEYAASEIGKPEIIQEIDHYIKQYNIGGIAYVGPSEYVKQVSLTNHYQAISKYPLLIAQDLEWGLAMRIKDGMRFPKNSTLGAVKNNRYIYEMGKEVGRQARLIGVHMNLSPVLDVNNEPENIAINVRSFGSISQEVSEKGIAMIHGLQDAGIIASAKHFPGIGDISLDPHLGLPYSKHNRKRLQDVELYPFVQAIKAGVLSIQTEHLVIPALESELNTPSSLSAKVVGGLLKKELGFSGLVLSGALRMKALTRHIPQEEIILKAFLAGHDMLLMPEDFPNAYQTLNVALDEGVITEKELDERVLKILQMKEWAKLDSQKIIAMPTREQLYTDGGQRLKKLLYANAVNILRDRQHLIPIPLPQKETIAYLQLGDLSSHSYLNLLSKQLSMDSYFLSLECDDLGKIEALLKQLEGYSLILLTIYPADPRRIEQIRLTNKEKQKEELKHFRVHGIPESLLRLICLLQSSYDAKMITTFFGNPFGLHFFNHYSAFIMAYEADLDAEQAAANLLLGLVNK